MNIAGSVALSPPRTGASDTASSHSSWNEVRRRSTRLLDARSSSTSTGSRSYLWTSRTTHQLRLPPLRPRT